MLANGTHVNEILVNISHLLILIYQQSEYNLGQVSPTMSLCVDTNFCGLIFVHCKSFTY